jgi:Apea-like HEPN
LLVFKSEPRPKFVHVWGQGVVTRGLDQFESSLNDTRARINQDWSAEKSLAYRLVHAALRDTNPETQHIQLVTAVEVLLEQQDRPEAVMNALNGVIDEVAGRPADEDGVRTRLLEILRDNLDESISRAASDQLSAVLADTYDGKAVDVFFRQVYNMRSRLLHRKRRRQETRPTATQLGDVHFELLRLVLDFLETSE